MCDDNLLVGEILSADGGECCALCIPPFLDGECQLSGAGHGSCFHFAIVFCYSGFRPARFRFKTGKAAALPVAKLIDFVQGRNIYWVATAIGVVRPLAGLGSIGIKNALSLYSGVFHRPRSEPLYSVLRWQR